jgi:hypothetical protein
MFWVGGFNFCIGGLMSKDRCVDKLMHYNVRLVVILLMACWRKKKEWNTAAIILIAKCCCK